MPTIIDLFKRYKRDIDKVVDTTFFRLMQSEDPIDQVMPINDYTMRKLLMLKFNRSKPTIGSIIAEEQEVPISRGRLSITEELMGNLKLGKAYGFLDKHFELMQDAELYFESNREMYNNIVEYFFGIAAQIPGAIVGKHTILTMQIATTGSCLFTDPLTGARVSLTYPDADVGTGASNLVRTDEPAAIDAWATSTGTAGSFNTPNAAVNGLQQLRTRSELYFDKFGKYPDNMVMRQRALRWLRDQTTTRTAYSVSQGGTAATTQELGQIYLRDEQVIELIKQATNIPNIILFDAQYSEEAPSGNVVDKYYLTEDYIFMLDNLILERAFVPTIERDFAPGIYSIAEVKSQVPRREQFVGVGNGVPACFDARKLCAQRIARASL